MALIELWQNSRHQLETKHVSQVIAFAGAGRLRDSSITSEEFRDFLAQIPSDMLARFAAECLDADKKFVDSGLALQDVVNEVGRRLGFEVEDGRYRGTSGVPGQDGLWRTRKGHAIVVEVKTSDTYRIELKILENYRLALAREGQLDEDASSLLLVVGRQSTEDMEAQIRGSRYAWSMRMISVEALLRLLRLRESMDDPAIVSRISAILIPREFTRLDEIVDIVFFAAEEVRPIEVRPIDADTDDPEDEIPPEDDPEVAQTVQAWPGLQRRQPPFAFHAAVIAQTQHHLGRHLLKRSKTGYSTPDHAVAVACLASRPHFRRDHVEFWFAFHPHQRDFLLGAGEGWVAFGCGTEAYILLVPLEEFEPWLGACTPKKDGRQYWHVRLHATAEAFTLHRGKGEPDIDMTRYLLPIWGWM